MTGLVLLDTSSYFTHCICTFNIMTVLHCDRKVGHIHTPSVLQKQNEIPSSEMQSALRQIPCQVCSFSKHLSLFFPFLFHIHTLPHAPLQCFIYYFLNFENRISCLLPVCPHMEEPSLASGFYLKISYLVQSLLLTL